jgi:hypothetical protein
VLDEAARLVFNAECHVTPLPHRPHYMAARRITHKLMAVLVFTCLHCSWSWAVVLGWWNASHCWHSYGVTSSSDISYGPLNPSHSSSSIRRPSAFPVLAARTWNSLPPDVVSSRTFDIFKSILETYLNSFFLLMAFIFFQIFQTVLCTCICTL